jgi:hypothetical protein
MWESSVQGLKLIESIAAEWNLSSQSKQINNRRPKPGGPILQLPNSCNSSWRSHSNMVEYRVFAQHPWLTSSTSLS